MFKLRRKPYKQAETTFNKIKGHLSPSILFNYLLETHSAYMKTKQKELQIIFDEPMFDETLIHDSGLT